jgi:hypothetical protein
MLEKLKEAFSQEKIRGLVVYISDDGNLGVQHVGVNPLEEVALAELLVEWAAFRNTKKFVAQMLMPKPTLVTPGNLQ